MKTSAIDVRDMLSVLSVAGVEGLIGEVSGVESVTELRGQQRHGALRRNAARPG